MKNIKRTNYCAELTESDIGKKVCVMGWAQTIRDKGGLIFIDLRDRTGIIQLAFGDSTPKAAFETASNVKREYVLIAVGAVKSRGSDANKDKKTGAIEIDVEELTIMSEAKTPPFEIEDNSKVNEELRLKYRYLDLRRPELNQNIMFRHQVQRVTRDFFYDNGFIDIETPNLIKPTPEGARDYIVPSRVHNGKFYVLPQSPQLYKQILMIAGFDRYFQIARCFRDEDLRADRQPEFTQIDLEMSFMEEDEIFELMEEYMKTLFKKTLNVEITTPFLRITYDEAMDRFGSDKPDMRFSWELKDISDTVKNCGFKVFAETIANGGSVRALKIEDKADMPRKEIDALSEYVKTYKAKGLAWYKWTETPTSSYSKFLTEEENAEILNAVEAKQGDLIFIIADASVDTVRNSLGALRLEIARRTNSIPKNTFAPLWVTNFPMFEYNEDDGKYYANHHPFTRPQESDIELLETAPEKMHARMYDMVINGFELGSGSMRINDPVLQEKILNFLGYTQETAYERFGFLLEAYKYAAPIHGGIAFGLDRLTTILLGLTSIRDVIAFPKVQNASDPMSGAPSFADEGSLTELGIEIIRKE